MSKLVLTEKQIQSSNRSKKRNWKVFEWKDNAAKVARNTGASYVNRLGVMVHGIPAPLGLLQGKVCGPSCTKPNCIMTAAREQELFDHFMSSGNFEIQNALLFAMIRRVELQDQTTGQLSRRLATFQYVLPDEQGIMREVCKPTLMTSLGISKRRVQTIQSKISTGRLLVSDGRGSHENRTNVTPQAVRNGIIDHINSFPAELSHYSRNHGNPERRYLDKELTLKKMFELYNATVGQAADSHYSLYKQEFRNTGLIIGHPRSDTCCICDKNIIAMSSANNPQDLNRLDLESILHHSKSDAAYTNLKDDTNLSIANPNFEVITFDLQQVLFCPVLTNSEYFYKRKYSCYNFAVTTPKEGTKTQYYYWHETIATRGADEVASCLLLFIKQKFQPLLPGQVRTLISYSDRCGGQNCNWAVICMLRLVLHLGYFTEVIHKYMSTGHSFLPCDRAFALIERQKKTSTVYIPEDWVHVIKNANASNEVYEMTQLEFLSFDGMKHLYRQPTNLKITEILGIRLTRDDPGKIFTRISHEPGTTWDEHNADHRFGIYQQPIQLHQKFHNPIPILQAKREDLHSMCEFLLPELEHSIKIYRLNPLQYLISFM